MCTGERVAHLPTAGGSGAAPLQGAAPHHAWPHPPLPGSSQEGMYVHVVLDAMGRGYSSQHNKLGMIGE